MKRRQVLRGIVTGGSLGIFGCLSDERDDSPTTSIQSEAPSSETQKATESETRSETRSEPSSRGQWSYKTNAQAATPLAVNDGTLYIGSQDGHAYAFDAATGDVRWERSVGTYIGGGVTMTNGDLYVGADEALVSLDPESGKNRWRFGTDRILRAPPSVVDGVAYLGSVDRHIYAVDAASGDELWAAEAGTTHRSGIQASPAVADGTVYVGGGDGSAFGFDAETGEERWSTRIGGRVYADPVVSGDTLYVGDGGELHALDAATGEERWRHDAPPRLYSTSRIVDDVLYLGIGNDYRSPAGAVQAIDLSAEGEVLWTTGTGAHSAAPTVTGDSLFFAAGDRLLTLSVDDGSKHREVQLNSAITTKPTVTPETAFVGTEEGVVRAIERER